MSADIHIAAGLAKIGMFLRSDQWRQADTTAMTPTQAQILTQLVRRGPARITALADEIAVTQPTASDAAGALLRKGHLERKPDPADARASLLHPTRSGRKAAEAIAMWPDALLAATNTLDPDEKAAFLKGLTKMIRALQTSGSIPVQRMCATCRYFRPNAHDNPAAPHHCEYVDAAFGDAALRLDCGEYVAASTTGAAATWRRFAGIEAEQADAPSEATDEAS